MSPWIYVAGAFGVGFIAGAAKQRAKDDREILAAGEAGIAFASALASKRKTMTTKSQGLAHDVRFFLALDEDLTGASS